MSEKKRKAWTVEEKAHIIWRLEAGESNTDIAKECGVNQSTISTIWKDREKVKKLFDENVLNKKRSRISEHNDIEQALLK